MLVLLTQLFELLPTQSFCLVQFPPPPPPFPVWISILHTRLHTVQCVRRGGGDRDLSFRQINTCRKVPLQANFFRWRHFALPSISLLFSTAVGMKQISQMEKTGDVVFAFLSILYRTIVVLTLNFVGSWDSFCCMKASEGICSFKKDTWGLLLRLKEKIEDKIGRDRETCRKRETWWKWKGIVFWV